MFQEIIMKKMVENNLSINKLSILTGITYKNLYNFMKNQKGLTTTSLEKIFIILKIKFK